MEGVPRACGVLVRASRLPLSLITNFPTLPHVYLLSTFRASTLSQSHRVQVRRSLVRPLQCEVFLPLRLGRN